MKDIFKVKEVRAKLAFTSCMGALVCAGSQIPVPGINREYVTQWFSQRAAGAFNVLSAFTGGSFERMSLFALGITPYITSSIVIQLLSIAIPSLEDLHKDGQFGKDKLEKITLVTAVLLAAVEAIAMCIGFARSGMIQGTGAALVLKSALVAILLTAGAGILMMIGKLITKKGIGNGISIILLINIISRIPSDIASLIGMFVAGKGIARGALALAIILAVIVGMVAFVVWMDGAHRRIPVIYSKKGSRGQGMGSVSTFIPVKLNTAGVVPVIFASSLLSLPQMAAAVIGRGYGGGVSAFLLNMVNQDNWFSPAKLQYTIGFVIYAVMVVFFAYFYTTITFNPVEVADNLRKQGGSIPGIRAGKPTQDYIAHVTGRLTFIGALYLLGAVTVPILLNGLFGASVSFGGTSLIIIVGVLLETGEQVETMLAAHHREGFLLG